MLNDKHSNNNSVENATLIKFGQYEHICQLQDEGLLYMNNLPYFWQIEDDYLRGDVFESVTQIRRGNSGTATQKNNIENPFEITSWVIQLYPSEPEKINIFCMYVVRPLKGSFPVDERNLQFGDHALIFTNPQEFIYRISSQLRSNKVAHQADLVEYIDDDYTGEVGPFKKLNRFAYQSEWRLVCFDGTGKELILFIGSIQDICILVQSKDVNKTLSELFSYDLT